MGGRGVKQIVVVVVLIASMVAVHRAPVAMPSAARPTADVDLEAVDLIVWPEIPTVGHIVSLSPQIANNGTIGSPTCQGALYINEVLHETFDVQGMNAGVTVTTEPVYWTPSENGSYEIRFTLDHGDVIAESNEDNNDHTITLAIGSWDNTPPELTVTYAPLNPTEMDAVTFYAQARDESGISSITIMVNTTPSLQYFGTTSSDATTCTLAGGTLPRKDTVYYRAQAHDKAGNMVETPLRHFTVQSFYAESPTVAIFFSPDRPTDVDTITITATAYYPYGIQTLRLISYGRMYVDPAIPPQNYTVAEEEEVTSVSIVRGPFAPEATLRYWAQAEDVDGHVVNTSMMEIMIRDFEIGENQKNRGEYREYEIFMIADTDWMAALQLVPLSIWRNPDGSITRYPTLIYHKENETAFDADAALRFLQQYEPLSTGGDVRVTLLGDPPDDLIRLLVSTPPVGPGLRESQIRLWRPSDTEATFEGFIRLNEESILETRHHRDALVSKGLWAETVVLTDDGGGVLAPTEDVYTEEEEQELREVFWDAAEVFVVCEAEYSTALMASVFASHLNAPLLFQGYFDPAELDYKSVYLVGDFTADEVQALRDESVNIVYRYTHGDVSHPQDICRYYAQITGTDKVILVNPTDFWTHRRETYQTDCAGAISYLFGRHSLAAPFLAAVKQEVIIDISSSRYLDIDALLKQRLEALPLTYPLGLTYLTILASPEAIPIARPNMGYPVALHEDAVFYHGFRYGDVDIVETTFAGATETPITLASGMEYNPSCSDEIVAWVHNFDIWYHDLSGGSNRQVTTNPATQCRPAVYGDTIVWQDFRNVYVTSAGDITHQWDIYTYDTSRGLTTRITSEDATQEYPAIWGDNVVWQDTRNGNADIYLHDLASGQELQITSDAHGQFMPAVSFNKIVYVDNRHGNNDIYLSWLGVGGTSVAGERQITTDGNMQHAPRIWHDRVVWHDNRNGNWDIYYYNVSTGAEWRITYDAIDQLFPVIWDDTIAWYERADDGWWYIRIYDIPTGVSRRIARTGASADDSVAWWLELDGRFYGSTDNLGYQDLPTGRIYGVTVADAAAYIARDVFFEDMDKNTDALLVERENWGAGIPGNQGTDEAALETYARTTYWTPSVEAQFGSTWLYSGHTEVAAMKDVIHTKYDECALVIYEDHGWTGGFSDTMEASYLQNNKVSLQSPVVLDLACLTGAYNVEVTKALLFSAQNIRRGAMVYMGATDVSYWHRMLDDILTEVYLNGKTIGQAYLEARNEEYDENVWNFSLTARGDIFYALHGDPTFRPRWW